MTAPHSAPVSVARAAPDGRTLASGGYDRSLRIWDAASGEVLRVLCGHTGLVNGLDWSPDGTLLASASSDHSARIWHALTGRTLAQLRGHGDDVNAVRWSPDGTRLATASFDGSVRVWTRSGECRLVAAHHASDVNGLAWFPDGRRLAATSDDWSVSIFEADSGRVQRFLRGHTDWVDDVAIHRDGLVLASAGQDGTVGIWDVATGMPRAWLRDAVSSVKAVAWSPDGSELGVCAYDGKVRVYAFGSWRLLRSFAAEELWNRTLDWTAQGWLTGSFWSGPVLLSDAGTRRLGRATSGLNGITVAPDGRRALGCSDDGRLYSLDLERRTVEGELRAHRAAVLSAAFSPDGEQIASSSWDRTALLWRRGVREPVAQWPGHGDPINAVAFSTSGERVYLGTFDGEIVEWDPVSGATRVLGQHRGSVKSLAVTPEGVVSVGRDGWVRRFEHGTVQEFHTGESILNGVAVSADARRVATVSRRNGVELWTGAGVREAHYGTHRVSAKSVALDGDGKVAAVYYDGNLVLWDPQTQMARLERISDASLSRVVCARGGWVVSGWDAAATVHLLDAKGTRAAELRIAG